MLIYRVLDKMHFVIICALQKDVSAYVV